MAVRNKEKGLKVRDELIESIVGDQKKVTRKQLEENIMVRVLDLGSLKSVLDFATNIFGEFKQQPVDLLINNAAIMALPEYSTTSDGIEAQIGVNYVGHYYLSRLLLGKMAENGRIISLSSRSHAKAPEPIGNAVKMMETEVEHPQSLKDGYGQWTNYGMSKAFSILFARELHRRKGAKGVVSVSVHPGVIRTGLQKQLTADFLSKVTFAKTVQQGAATTVLLAVMPRDEISPGGYYADCNLHDDLLRKDLQPVGGFIAGKGFDDCHESQWMESNEFRLWEATQRLIETNQDLGKYLKGTGFAK